MKTDYYIS